MTDLSESGCESEIRKAGWHTGLDGRWKKLPRSKNYDTAKQCYEAEFEPRPSPEEEAETTIKAAGWLESAGKWQHPEKPHTYDTALACYEAEFTKPLQAAGVP